VIKLLPISWHSEVSIFNDNTILKQLGIAIGIPFGVLLIFLVAIQAWYGVLLVAATLFLGFIFVLLVYGGKYSVDYVVDDRGIRMESDEDHKNKAKTIGILTFLAGIFSKSPTVSGAGLLSTFNDDKSMAWEEIKDIQYNNSKNLIVVKGSPGDKLYLFCPPELYGTIRDALKESLDKKKNSIHHH
jgi:hypothetical protein